MATTRQEKVRRFREADTVQSAVHAGDVPVGQDVLFKPRIRIGDQLAEPDSAERSRRRARHTSCLGWRTTTRGNSSARKTRSRSRFPSCRLPRSITILGPRRCGAARGALCRCWKKRSKSIRTIPITASIWRSALYRFGDPALAVKNLRESLARYPTDSGSAAIPRRNHRSAAPATAKAGVPAGSGNTAGDSNATVASIAKLPLPRIKRNYDESSFRMLALGDSELEQTDPGAGQRCANQCTTSSTGTELLDRGLTADAENEFHQALANRAVERGCSYRSCAGGRGEGRNGKRANGSRHFPWLASDGGGLCGAGAGGHAAEAVYVRPARTSSRRLSWNRAMPTL